MNLTANEGATGEYWTTFYNKNHNFQAADGTQIFKAALSGTSLALTELTTDQIVTKNNAVILKSTSPTITLTKTASSSSNSFTGNSLLGVTDPAGLTANGTHFVLNKGSNGVGFYKMKSGKKIGVGKAYLTYSSASSPEFFEFDDDITRIVPIEHSPLTIDHYYDLQGRKVERPTRGIYIVNGKKVFIK